jgi:vancomycin resistance protein VanW
MAGLEVLERHPHSRDIYDDHTRYAPLGADATVAYGFKDVRVLNCLSFPVCFRVSVRQSKVTCWVCSPEPIEESQIEFVRTATGDGLTLVETRRRLRGQDGDRILAVSSYRRLVTH